MASFRYCDNPLPHDSHEWYEPPDEFAGYVGGSYFHCCGVKPSGALDVIAATIRDAEAVLAMHRLTLATESIKHRRTVRQFYEGDDAPEEYDDDPAD